MQGRALAFGGALLVAAALAAPASGSVAKVEGSFIPFASLKDKADEANQLTVSLDPDGKTLTFHDLTSTIEPRHRCEGVPIDTFRVDCNLGHGPGVYLDVSTGGGADGLTNLLSDDPRFLIVFLDTGPGADFVSAGSAEEEITPGMGDDIALAGGSDDTFVAEPVEDGDDQLSGGAGADLLDYSEREERTFVSFADGHGGGGDESDQLTGIEGAEGGSAVDRFTGDAASNYFFGAAGPDRVDDAAGGPDFLDGGAARDVIHAGAGSDFIYARDRHEDLIDCGQGRDVAFADRRDTVRHCELDRPGPGFFQERAKAGAASKHAVLRRWRSR